MSEDERFVREYWRDVYDDGYSVHIIDAGRFTGAIHRWSAATEFTRTRLKQIRQVEEEIEQLSEPPDTENGEYWSYSPAFVKIRERILAREQSALVELKRGMKGTV